MSVIGHHHDDDDEVTSTLFVDFVLLDGLPLAVATAVATAIESSRKRRGARAVRTTTCEGASVRRSLERPR